MGNPFQPELQQMVDKRMATGFYASEDEMLLEALRALDELNRQHQDMKDEIQKRIAQAGKGLSMPLDVEALKSEGRARLGIEERRAPQ